MTDEGVDADERSEEEEESAEESGTSSSDDQSDAKPATPPPPIELPDRATRGRRLRQKVDEEEEDADNEFWQQDFFADGDADEDYSTESSDTDRADSDFDRAESSDDGEGDGNEERLRAVLKTKKAKDKPPGWKQAAQRRANLLRVKRLRDQSVKADAAPEASEGPSTSAATNASKPGEPPAAPVLRRSTYQKRETDEMRRQVAVPRRSAPKKEKEPTPALTMEDVLRRAAADSLANRAALAHMLAREEESKARATASRAAYDGPSLRRRSRGVPIVPEQAAPARAGAPATLPATGTCSDDAGPSTSCHARGGLVEATEIELVKTALAQVPSLFLASAPRAQLHVPHGLVIDSKGVARPRTTRVAAVAPERPQAPSGRWGWDLSTVDWGAPRAARISAYPVECALQRPDGGVPLSAERPASTLAHSPPPPLLRVPLLQRAAAHERGPDRASVAQGHLGPSTGALPQPAPRAPARPAGQAAEPGPGGASLATQQRDDSGALLPSGFSKRGRRTTPSERRLHSNDEHAARAVSQTPARVPANGQQALPSRAHTPAASPSPGVARQAPAAGLQRQILCPQPRAPVHSNVGAQPQSARGGHVRGLNGEHSAPQLAETRQTAANPPNGPFLQRAPQHGHALQQFAPASAPAVSSHSALLHRQALQLLQQHQQAQFQASLQREARAQASATLLQQAGQQASGAHASYAHGGSPAPLWHHTRGDSVAAAVAAPAPAQPSQLLSATHDVQRRSSSQGHDAGLRLQEYDPG